MGLGGIWAEDGERGSGKRTERERERVERKQLHRQTDERTNALFATEFTTDAEIARGVQVRHARALQRQLLQRGQVSTMAKLLHFPGLFVIDARGL